jgi:5'-deoxynucleotidase YfbR-like HD superfamily hydrolase
MEIDLVYASNNVKRFHTIYTIQTQTVGAHSANMLGLLLAIGYRASVDLYNAIIIHDWPEVFTGDIPANFKKISSEFSNALTVLEDRWYAKNNVLFPRLDDLEQWLLCWLDAVEAAAFCQTEIRLGNTLIAGVYNRYRLYIAELLNDDAYLQLKENVRINVDNISDKLTAE